MQTAILVDYDNSIAVRPERTHLDLERNLELAVQAALRFVRDWGHRGECWIRLYGGWIDAAGTYSLKARWLFPLLPSIPRTQFGMRLRVDMAYQPLAHGGGRLVGTQRIRDGRSAQKMVDTMIVADMLWLSQTNCPLVLMSSDEDCVPGLLAVQAQNPRRATAVLRCRGAEGSLNDRLLATAGVEIKEHRYE